jgi:hypothetical protein
MRAMSFQSTTKFLPGLRWVLGSRLFIADKFGDLNLQEPKSCEVVRSGTVHLPPAPTQVSPINEAQLGHESIQVGKMDSNPSGDKADHTLAISVAITDPIYQSPLESDFKGDKEVLMVGDKEQHPEKTTGEIAWEAEEEITWVAHLARRLGQGRGTMAYRMTLGNLMLRLGMVLFRGGITQSSTLGALLTETDSETGHGQSERKLAVSSTKENMSTARQLTMPWP